jgi:hypothetical protein
MPKPDWKPTYTPLEAPVPQLQPLPERNGWTERPVKERTALPDITWIKTPKLKPDFPPKIRQPSRN